MATVHYEYTSGGLGDIPKQRGDCDPSTITRNREQPQAQPRALAGNEKTWTTATQPNTAKPAANYSPTTRYAYGANADPQPKQTTYAPSTKAAHGETASSHPANHATHHEAPPKSTANAQTNSKPATPT